MPVMKNVRARSTEAADREGRSARLFEAIEQAAEFLPAQRPISVFIHHNTLHAFETLPFTEGVERAAAILGCQPYLDESAYRQELARGRIRVEDLKAVLMDLLGEEAGQTVAVGRTRMELRLAMLEHEIQSGPSAELAWYVAETDALRCVRDDVSAATRRRFVAETRRWVMRDLRGRNGKAPSPIALDSHDPVTASALGAELSELEGRLRDPRIEHWSDDEWESLALSLLWSVCLTHVPRGKVEAVAEWNGRRHRDLILEATGYDCDVAVHEVLVPFCAAFHDQGFAHWPMPSRESGLYRAFLATCRVSGQRIGGLTEEVARLQRDAIGHVDSILESLAILGVPEVEWESFLAKSLLALRGWAGMTRVLESRDARATRPVDEGSLVEFVAVRLLLDRLACRDAARDVLGYDGPLANLRDHLARRNLPTREAQRLQRAFSVFQIAQILGWTPEILVGLGAEEWDRLTEEIQAFSSIPRRRVFHLAYERRFTTSALDALALHERFTTGDAPARFQAIFCLDEREESMRRHLEEVAPDAETFGTAGFFGVAMLYRGAADARFRPLCPIVVEPRHWVVEEVAEDDVDDHRRRSLARRALGSATHRVHVGSRSAAGGALVAGTLGLFASIPLVARVLFPRLTARLRRLAGRVVRAPQATQLRLERRLVDSDDGDAPVLGFTLDERAAISERFLHDLGLTRRFARLVVILGHGSRSLNNPHRSAYDCGACGGNSGAPNARAIARMLNDAAVRMVLARRGLTIPEGTWFVGGVHLTSDDAVAFFDLDALPASHRKEFGEARRDLERAAARNAHERCRRFHSAPLTLSFEAAKQHVEERSEDLAQTRPELGHATNALCIVGRRERTRGLFLDRRAFLASYDPTQDDRDATVLTRTLQAVFPVCGGINLEYFFSRVDNAGYGCGSKLPHNLTSLLGVMDGALGDLRTGLPWQMVEIHEPVRLLVVVETTPEVLTAVLDRHDALGRLARNGWLHLAALDPRSARIWLLRGERFEPFVPRGATLPRAASSVDWYRGWRDHLDFARIGA